MRKTILLYGIALAALTGILKFIEYRFLIRDLTLEVYLGIVAVFVSSERASGYQSANVSPGRSSLISRDVPVLASRMRGRSRSSRSCTARYRASPATGDHPPEGETPWPAPCESSATQVPSVSMIRSTRLRLSPCSEWNSATSAPSRDSPSMKALCSCA